MDFFINCGECNRVLLLSNAREMREHATGTYSFLCRACNEEDM